MIQNLSLRVLGDACWRVWFGEFRSWTGYISCKLSPNSPDICLDQTSSCQGLRWACIGTRVTCVAGGPSTEWGHGKILTFLNVACLPIFISQLLLLVPWSAWWIRAQGLGMPSYIVLAAGLCPADLFRWYCERYIHLLPHPCTHREDLGFCGCPYAIGVSHIA